MRNLFFKMLERNRNDYLLVIFCGTVMISLVYATSALAGCLNYITMGSAGGFTEVYITLGIFILSYVLFFFLMVLVVLDYIRKRSNAYALLSILGIQKKHKYMFIGAEYAGIIGGSICGGLFLGFLEAIALKKVLKYIFTDIQGQLTYGEAPVKIAMIVGFVMFGVLFVVCDELIACLGIDALISFGKRQGKTFHKSPVLAGIGIFFLAIAFASQWTYWGKLTKIFPTVLASAGMLFLMIAATGMFLIHLRKRTNKYYQKILWLNNWYHRFSYNVNMTYIVTMFLFVILFIFGMKVLDHYPVNADDAFVYDLVWMADREDEEFLDALVNDYGVEIFTQECIRVTTPDFGEHMAISASEYEKWTGEIVELAEDEVYVVYQRGRGEQSELGVDYSAQYPRFYIGNAKKGLWISSEKADPIPSRQFVKYHRLKGETNRVLTGIYECHAIEAYAGKVWEDIIVFSDKYFEKVENTAKGANLAVMMNIPEHYEEVTEKIYAYAKEHSQVDGLDKEGRNLIYETKPIKAKLEKENAFEIASNLINICILFAGAAFILFVKQRCDFEELAWKYQFYNRAGMSYKKRKKYVRREVCLPTVLALMSGIALTVFYIGGNLMVKKLEIFWLFQYLKWLSVLCVTAVVVLLLISNLFAGKNFAEIERRNRDV